MSASRGPDQYTGYRHPFLFGTHYLGGVGDNPRTLIDLAMGQLSWQIRSIPGWWNAYAEKSNRNMWKEEATNHTIKVKTPSDEVDIQLSSKQIDYVLDELQGYISLMHDHYQVSCFERIWQSSNVFAAEAALALKDALEPLADDASKLSDDIDNPTIDLIDPTLCPLVYFRTLVRHYRLLDSVYQTVSPLSTGIQYATSSRFALLPTDVFVPENLSYVKLLSYINNLDPSAHENIYQLLERLLMGFIPLFEHTLTDLHRTNPLVPRIRGSCQYTVWDEPDSPEHSDDEEGWANYEREMRQWTLNRPISLPDVPEQGYTGGLESRRHKICLRGRKIQIVTSISKIKLMPGGKEYSGSQWHVEGMRAERIVACGLHVLSMDNITGNSIRFRMAVTFPRHFSPGDEGASWRTWGFRDGDSSHQYIGDVSIRPNLSLVFPNIYQHCQTPFKLVDPSRDGHLTLIKFFLVDPDIIPIISTSRVAPQQSQWIYTAIDKYLDSRLPSEVVQLIMQNVEGLMTAEEAVSYRKQFIDERDRFTHSNNSYHFCVPFDIWNTSP